MARPRTKRHILIENAACLDLRSVRSSGLLQPERWASGLVPLVHHLNGTSAGYLSVDCDLGGTEGTLTVHYARDGRTVEQTLALTSLPRPPFGGRRWFFICPVTGELACRLFLTSAIERFASRQALGLRYTSEHASDEDRDIDLVWRHHVRMTGRLPSEGALTPPPRRPRGMHRRTYRRLSGDYCAAQELVVGRLREDLAAWGVAIAEPGGLQQT